MMTLFTVFELGNSKWKLGFSTGEKNREVNVTAGDLVGVLEAISKTLSKWNLPVETKVCSLYEAGRDGFWLHRYLECKGIENMVVDSASIEVNRRRRRVKTDRLDVGGLLRLLRRYHDGDVKACSKVRVPSVEQEDERRREREIKRIKEEVAAHKTRIRSLLVQQGEKLTKWKDFEKRLEEYTQYDGQPLPPLLKGEILREYERMQFAQKQVQALQRDRRERLANPRSKADEIAQKLTALRGIGEIGAMTLSQEFFSWREFRNVRQVGACAGLTGTGYNSGDSEVEQGISKAGNKRVRALMIELAWCWLRYQPDSKLARWFQSRWERGKRIRRIGIVALARKLLVALWKYLEHGEALEGAVVAPS